MADLPVPEQRLTPNLASFSNVGLDCVGPFLTRKDRGSIERCEIIFTCLSLRAVHIEVAYSLFTTSFIQALRKFVARRSEVLRIWSDNNSNIVGGVHKHRYFKT